MVLHQDVGSAVDGSAARLETQAGAAPGGRGRRHPAGTDGHPGPVRAVFAVGRPATGCRPGPEHRFGDLPSPGSGRLRNPFPQGQRHQRHTPSDPARFPLRHRPEQAAGRLPQPERAGLLRHGPEPRGRGGHPAQPLPNAVARAVPVGARRHSGLCPAQQHGIPNGTHAWWIFFHLGSTDLDPYDAAIRETQAAIRKVDAGLDNIELSPQPSMVRDQQHQLARAANLASNSLGREPHRRVKIFRQRT